MEILIKAITFTLLFLLFASPLFVTYGLSKLNRKNNFVAYIVLGIVTTFILTWILGWWSSFSNDLLLSHYGYDFEAMNNFERFKNVANVNLERVKSLETSMMGIGWPLKVIMSYIFYSPIFSIIYLAVYFFKRNQERKASLLNPK
jgi:hypothetical protein